MKTKVLASVPVAILLCSMALPGCAQQQSLPSPSPTPRPDTLFSSGPPASDHDAEIERQLKAMQGIHERMKNARTPQERRALMDEHRRVMRQAMDAMQGIERTGMGHGRMPGHRMQRHMAMMQMMLQMMMDRMDTLDPPK